MRDPHTLVNIACLFGMKEQQAYVRSLPANVLITLKTRQDVAQGNQCSV